MAKEISNMETKDTKVKINTLEDLIRLNLNTLEDVISEEIDNRKAALIFTGSRTVAAAFKLGLEAVKLGLKQVSGMGVGNSVQISAPKDNRE